MEKPVNVEEKDAVLASGLPCENSGEPVVSGGCSESIGDVATDAVDVMAAASSGVLPGEPVDSGQSDGGVGAPGVVGDDTGDTGEPVESQKRSRRSNGSGSIWQAGNGKFGIAIQLGKAEDGKKLRHVQYYPSLEEAEKGLTEHLSNVDKLRKSKLAKTTK